EDVIENSAAKLYTTKNYLSSWSVTNSDESLFEIYLTDNIKNNPQRNGLGGYTSVFGYGEVGVNDEILNIFNEITDSTDIRKNIVALEVDTKTKKTGWYVQKYKGRPDATNWMYVNNPKIIRLAEVYYIAAEAALKSGDQAKADKYYNKLRETRFENGFVAKNNITIDDILEDRRIELFCENHRMFDLVRNNKEIPSWNTDAVRKANAFDILCPIPQSETDVNPDMKQNPGF
ncbi:MAG: RagB/SusD family nutrient uptake outer membrane protein, partial [Bacteroidales bacterium]